MDTNHDNGNTSSAYSGSNEDLQFIIVRAVIYIALCLVILFGNLLVIVSVVKFKALWTVTNKFLISLSIADTISVPGMLTYYTYLVFTDNMAIWRWGLVFNLFPAMLSQAMSLFTLLHIAIDRYIAVIHAVSYKQLMTHHVANIMIVSTWLYSALLLGTIVGYFGYVADDEVFENKRLIEAIPAPVNQAVISPHIYLAILLTCLLYGRIFWAIRSNKVGQAPKSASAEAKSKKVTQLMVTVLGILLLCWMPYAIFSSVVDPHDPNLPSYVKYVRDVCFFLLYINSCTNPILYGLKSPDFRRAYGKLLRRCMGKAKEGEQERSLGSTRTEQTQEMSMTHVG